MVVPCTHSVVNTHIFFIACAASARQRSANKVGLVLVEGGVRFEVCGKTASEGFKLKGFKYVSLMSVCFCALL